MNKILSLAIFLISIQVVAQHPVTMDCLNNSEMQQIENKFIIVLTPPEIKLDPVPARILIFRDYQVSDLKISRDEKEKLVDECLDTLLFTLHSEFKKVLPGIEFIIYHPEKETEDNALKKATGLIRQYNADIAIGIAGFRPNIVKGNITQTETYSGKTKTAEYFVEASGYINLYNKDSLLRSFGFVTGYSWKTARSKAVCLPLVLHW